MAEPYDLILGDWILKVRPPESEAAAPAILMIHGWTGDERSMWVFAPRLPRDAWLIAPRAPYISQHPKYGGFSWVPKRTGEFSRFEAFAPARASFDDLLTDLAARLDTDLATFAMLGFSQGAAFAYSYALTHPHRVTKLAGLAGFLPEGGEDELMAKPLAGKSVLIAHGLTDETVPIIRAHQAHDLLARAGADVQLCESNTGHKLGVNCFSQLAEFFQN